jgi:DNA primase
MYMKVPYNINRNCRCPLHKEKSWSFRIYKNTNSFYCFWCHKWWNIINFISEIENISNNEAFKKIISMYW